MNGDEARSFLGRMKLRQTRGSAWLQIIINFGVISANIRLFVPTATVFMYILSGVLWVLATVGVGYLDEIRGIWKNETAYAFYHINPLAKDQYDTIKNIEKILLGGVK